MRWQVESVFEEASVSLAREERRLTALGAAAMKQDRFDSEGVYAMSRALSYVIFGGALERLMRELPTAISADLSTLTIQRNQLPASFLAVTELSTFRKCQGNTVKALKHRVMLLTGIYSHDSDRRPIPELDEDLTLADGTTITSAHFEALWAVFGFSGDWRNSANDSLMLEELARKRNNIAHWEVDPVDVGRSRTTADLCRLGVQLGSLLDHVNLHIGDWLDRLAAAEQVHA